MNPVIPRLKIISLAISIDDKETIQLQVFKLEMIDKDPEIENIVSLIHEERYLETVSEIDVYLPLHQEEEKKSITPKAMNEKERLQWEEEQRIIDEFQLFVKPKRAEKIKKRDTPQTEKTVPVDYATLLNLDKEDINTDNFFGQKETPKAPIQEKAIIPIDTFFDTLHQKKDLKEIKIATSSNQTYPPISYIGTKLVDMKKLYPSEYYTQEIFFSVDALTSKICDEGYSEKEIEETLFYIKKLIGQKAYKEASQLLLLCGATESKFAHLMLARELYKGLLFKQDVSESFILINKLALEEHAEALCDLAQFYENGIGTKRDKKKAEKYYQESMDKGIKRAETHYTRIKKENSSFFKK